MKPFFALLIAASAACLSLAQAPIAPTQEGPYTEGQNHTTILQSIDPNFDDVRLDLVWIPPGTFTMGSPTSEQDSEKWEHPQTVVTLSQGFWLGKTVVTQAQYQTLMGTNPSHFIKAGPNAPVEQVTWGDATAFCRKLTDQERANGRLPSGYAFTLPTEAQWEYSCRAGSIGSRYAANLSAIAWYGKDSEGAEHPVAQKEPNAFGLYDMLGNVWEWCADWFGPYPGGSETDPVGPVSGTYRVERGGSWWSSAADCRSASRFWDAPGYRYNEILGFRVALSRIPLQL